MPGTVDAAPGGGFVLVAWSRRVAGAAAAVPAPTPMLIVEVDAAVAGRRVDLDDQRAHVVVGGHGLAEPRHHRVVRPVVRSGLLVGRRRCSPPAPARPACVAICPSSWTASSRFGASDEQPVGARRAAPRRRDGEEDLVRLRETSSSVGVAAGSRRWSWPPPASAWPSPAAASAGGRRGRRRRAGGGVAVVVAVAVGASATVGRRRRARRRRRRRRSGGGPCRAAVDAGGARRRAVGAGVGLLGLGERDAGDAVDVAQARHQRGDGSLAGRAARERDGRRGDRAAHGCCRPPRPRRSRSTPLSEVSVTSLGHGAREVAQRLLPVEAGGGQSLDGLRRASAPAARSRRTA